MVTVLLQPEGRTLEVKKANTVLQLLNSLKLKPTRTLVIRDNSLLTPDQPLKHGQQVIVRKVGSRG